MIIKPDSGVVFRMFTKPVGRLDKGNGYDVRQMQQMREADKRGFGRDLFKKTSKD